MTNITAKDVAKFEVIENTDGTQKIRIEMLHKTVEITRWKRTKQAEFYIVEHGDKRDKYSGFAIKDEQLEYLIDFLRRSKS